MNKHSIMLNTCTWYNMTIPRVTDIHNFHNANCNLITCIGFRLEKSQKNGDIGYRQYETMTNAKYHKAVKEITKLVKKLSPKLKIKKGSGFNDGIYFYFEKDPMYWKTYLRLYPYGVSNHISDIAFHFNDKKGKKHGKRITVYGLHRLEYATRKVIRHYERIYKK